jgi:DNA-binding response OmpR family regulator
VGDPPPDGNRVLVVEDDEHVRDAVTRALRFEGYDVITAVDGNDGLVQFDRHPPDAVVLDVLMPGTDGRRCVASSVTAGAERRSSC